MSIAITEVAPFAWEMLSDRRRSSTPNLSDFVIFCFVMVFIVYLVRLIAHRVVLYVPPSQFREEQYTVPEVRNLRRHKEEGEPLPCRSMRPMGIPEIGEGSGCMIEHVLLRLGCVGFSCCAPDFKDVTSLPLKLVVE